MKFAFSTVLLGALTCADLLGAGLIDEVPPTDRSTLAAGEMVVKSKDIKGAPWPELKVYQVVDAPPEVLIDLLNDYAAAPSYTPGMISAKVISDNPDGTKDVLYKVKVPILQSIGYTVRNTYQRSGSNFEVSWVLLRSPLARSGKGSLRVAPYGKNQSLLCYTNFVVPITDLVSGLKNQAKVEAQATVKAIEAEAERRAKLPKSQ